MTAGLGAMTPLEVAAADAEQEAARLLADAAGAMTLEGVSDLLYDRATDAIEAYQRARERAAAARRLADHRSGAYNAWDSDRRPG
jgi:hypothetical protein